MLRDLVIKFYVRILNKHHQPPFCMQSSLIFIGETDSKVHRSDWYVLTPEKFLRNFWWTFVQSDRRSRSWDITARYLIWEKELME